MSPPLVAVGIGNTTIKLGVADGTDQGRPRWSDTLEVATADFDPRQLARRLPPAAAWCVASVHRASQHRLAEWVAATHPSSGYRLLAAADLPLKIEVDEPDRVGMDRLVAAVAVNRLRDAARPAVVVDAGTAITVDVVSRSGAFQGGGILPGMRLIAKALAANTDLLPEVSAEFDKVPPDPIGRSTAAAIRSGLFWGAVGGVRELVRRMSAQCESPPQLFVTGGDARRLVPALATDLPPADVAFVDDLVLAGIAWAARS